MNHAAHFDIFSPIEQARRCLDLWLREEGKEMADLPRQRAAALIARYFYYEDDRSDALILSFLRHYSGRGEVDMEDPQHIRQEIKEALDSARPRSRPLTLYRITAAFCIGMMVSLAAFKIATMPMTASQQVELKMMVDNAARQNEKLTHAAIWAQIKKPLGVRSYQDISYWDYARAKKIVSDLR